MAARSTRILVLNYNGRALLAECLPSVVEAAGRSPVACPIMVVDNVVREGAVIDATSADESVQGVRRLTAWLATERRVTAVALQTVGSKGYDGFLLARVTAS